MRTIDAASYIQQKLAAEIARYPAGSVSKREVIYTVPHDDEETYQRLNATLTKLVYDQAREANLHKPAHFKVEFERLTALAVQACQTA